MAPKPMVVEFRDATLMVSALVPTEEELAASGVSNCGEGNAALTLRWPRRWRAPSPLRCANPESELLSLPKFASEFISQAKSKMSLASRHVFPSLDYVKIRVDCTTHFKRFVVHH